MHSHNETGESLGRIWLLSWLFVRLPANLDVQFATYLQSKTARLASIGLDGIGIPHYRTGNVFELLSGPMFVEEACSGVQSLFAVLFLATLIVVALRRPLVSTPLYWAAAVLWAVVMNLARIIAIATAQEVYGWDLAHGWKHAAVGYVSLAGALILLLSTDRLLRVLFFPIPAPETSQKSNPISNLWNRMTQTQDMSKSDGVIAPRQGLWGIVSPLLATVSILMIVGQILVWPRPQVNSLSISDVVWQPSAEMISADTIQLPVTKFESVRKSTDETIGSNADIWEIPIEGIPGRVALSQPYPEFHELTVCYSAIGWKLNSRSLIRTDSMDLDWAYVKASYLGEDGGSGLLLFAGLTRDGTIVQPTDSSLSSVFGARLNDWAKIPSKEDTLMIQLWLPSPGEITPDVIVNAEQLFLRCRNQIRNSLNKEADPK